MTAQAAASSPAPGDARRFRLLLALLALVTVYRGLCLYFGGLDLYVDEAQYWTWAQTMDWGYYSKPPVIAALIRLTTALGGDSPFCVKSGALLVYPLVTLLVWAIARHLFDARIAFWSALVFLLVPGVSLSSMIISTDVPFFLFWALALYAYIRALEIAPLTPPSASADGPPLSQGERGKGRQPQAAASWSWWLLAGAAAGLGMLTKYTMGIFAVSVLLHLALTPSLRRHFANPRLYAAMLAAALVFAPNLWWNARHGWPTLRHTEDISQLHGGAGLHWNHLSDFLGGQFAVMGPVFFGAWVGLTLWRPRSWWADQRYRLLACFALPFLGIICLQALFGRANANWGAMAYVGATIFTVGLMLQRDLKALFAAGLAINVLLMPLGYHFDALTRAFGVELKAKFDPYKRVRGWAELGRQAQLLTGQYPGALFLGDSRDVLAELMYYVHPHPLDAVLWNPQHVMDNHYALSTTMDDKRGRDFLYVSEAAQLSPQMLASFDGVEELPPLHVTVHPDYALDYRVWHLQGFKGYQDPQP